MFGWLIGIGLALGAVAIGRAIRNSLSAQGGGGKGSQPSTAPPSINVKTTFAPSPTPTPKAAASGDTIPVGALAELPVLPLDQWATLEFGGHTYKVHPTYLGPARIGEAAQLATKNGWTLPSPAMVDAIWRAADLKVMPHPQSPNKGMSASQAAAQATAIDSAVAGRPFNLLGGTHKDIVQVNGKHGIYGWHVADEDIAAFTKTAGFDPRKIGGPNATPGPGQIIQGANTTSHDDSYGDYSQGLRPIVQVS